MPYTPPNSTPVTGHASPKVDLPRSSSYFLHQHRRSPSFQDIPTSASYLPGGQPSRAGQSDADSHDTPRLSINPSVRQSPPPMSNTGMPAGAIISPPDSAQTSSDDDEEGADEKNDNTDGLNELKAAFKRSLDTKFEFPRSPTEDSSDGQPENDEQNSKTHRKPPSPHRLSPSARKISHSRSATEASFFVEAVRGTQSAPMSQHTSDESDEDNSDSSSSAKPPLLRKKSGELVKPAIRPQSRRKHSSMPGTPTYAKAVHFNDDIVQVRHFLQVDKPIAVSAGASPVDPLEDETEFPFSKQSSASTSWEIRLANFPRESLERMSKPVRLERVFLSPDQRSLIGVIAVANIAFQKFVVARFTLDYWKTTSEVIAEYSNDTRQPKKDGYDQFNFVIRLADQANLENKTMLLCIKYSVNGQDHWDNNDSTNFQIDFVKKKPAVEDAPSPGLGARPIPRSRHNSSSSMRPRSVPSFDDDFTNSFDPSSIRFRNNTTVPVLQDTPPPPTRRQNATAQQFGSRYDFGASLSAALSHAQAQLGDRSGIKPRTKAKEHRELQEPAPTPSSLARPGYTQPSASGVESPRPDSLLANKQALDSRAYQEFVSKFCFFGSGKPQSNTSSAKQQRPPSGDGAADETEDSLRVPNQANGKLSSPSGLSPAGSGTSSPLPVAGAGLDGRSSPLGLGFPFRHESPSGIFTPDAQTPTIIQG